jgi:hypothetical protein
VPFGLGAKLVPNACAEKAWGGRYNLLLLCDFLKAAAQLE